MSSDGNTFVDDGHFEWYADNSHKVLSGHQRSQDGANTQGFTFPLVDELEKGKGGENSVQEKHLFLKIHNFEQTYVHLWGATS